MFDFYLGDHLLFKAANERKDCNGKNERTFTFEIQYSQGYPKALHDD